MDKMKRMIAKKYASAFVHSFSSELSPAIITHLQTISNEDKKYSTFTSLLKLSTIDDAHKKKAFATIVRDYQLPDAFISLFDLLMAHKRPELWLMIITEIITLFCQERSIELTTISSSHALNQEQKNELVNLFERKSGKTVVPDFVIDPTLIMGIRMLSTHFYLERSFKKYITDIKNSIHN